MITEVISPNRAEKIAQDILLSLNDKKMMILSVSIEIGAEIALLSNQQRLLDKNLEQIG